MSEPTHTFHLTPLDVWSAQSSSDTYLPEAFADEAFIHCTDGEHRVIEVGNRYYASDPRPYCLLTLERERLTSRVIYEDKDRVYPHVYGPINANAVIEVRQVLRGEDGAFLGIGEALPQS